MRRMLLVAALACAGSVLFSGGAAANHSGHEDVALGRGEATATATTVESGGTIFPGLRCSDLVGIFVVCTETTTTTSSKFDFDAKLTGLGALNAGEPHGHMKLESSTTTTTTVFIFGTPGVPTTTTQSFTAAADVTCLRVANNRAVLSGRVSRFSGNATPQRGLLFNATDNTIAGTQLLPDEWAGALVPEALQLCPLPGADAPITKGDILIEDN